jgi:glycerol-3-phosphate O-acyltransferase/dihydroxyacetone phosphate acyltransferase
MAEASYNRPVIGHLAYAVGTFAMVVWKTKERNMVSSPHKTLSHSPPTVYILAHPFFFKSFESSILYSHRYWSGVVPVKRAQDDAKKGTGTIRMTLTTKDEKKIIQVEGIETTFSSELVPGDKIRPPGTPTAFKVVSVEHDKALTLNAEDAPEDYTVPKDQPVPFDVLKKVDTKTVFGKVLERLAAGGAVGIFPEGGSHDRTELLPLKVGIALIGYSALEKDGLNIPIVPVGLNYFRAHRWRGKAVVEYGKPTMINPATLDDYKAGGERKRQACNKLLENIESAMRSVIVSAPDYETLETIHTARRLYQRARGPMEAAERQNLARRFAEGYRRLYLMTKGNPPREWLELQDRIIAYRKELKELGIRDYQVPAIVEEHLDDPLAEVDTDRTLGFLQILYQIVHLIGLLSLAAVPILFLNLPVGLLAGIYAERRRKKALAKSKVKVKGFDVMLTEKIVFCSKCTHSCYLN